MPRHGSMKNLDLKEPQRMARFIDNTAKALIELQKLKAKS